MKLKCFFFLPEKCRWLIFKHISFSKSFVKCMLLISISICYAKKKTAVQFLNLYLVDRCHLNHVITVVTESLQNRLKVT